MIRIASTLGFIAACGTAFGCVLLADVDENRIPTDAVGTSSSTSSSSSTTGSGGADGGEIECRGDSDCPGVPTNCSLPRCFIDGRCGIDNEPIGAPCAENGGNACNGQGQCVECTASEHCASGKCGPDRTCLPPTCGDTIKNGDETDVDCGGSCAAHCGPGAGCVVNGDCTGELCEAGSCAASCKDSVLNGNETATDCGGLVCPSCPLGETCELDADCSSEFCYANVCTAIPTCTDDAKNGLESDIDCGGPACPSCSFGSICAEGNDCTSLSCVDGLCAAITCVDGVQNGTEIGIDCGSVCPAGCPTGTPCTVNEDCASQKCEGPAGHMACGEPSCFDGLHNGDETSYDCGGSCANKCPPFYPCLINDDCRGGLCDPVTLTCTPTCTDGYQNQGETDPDCGGPCAVKCPEGWHCYIDDDCAAGLYCTQGHCLP